MNVISIVINLKLFQIAMDVVAQFTFYFRFVQSVNDCTLQNNFHFLLFFSFENKQKQRLYYYSQFESSRLR